jgi:hypothetical protein
LDKSNECRSIRFKINTIAKTKNNEAVPKGQPFLLHQKKYFFFKIENNKEITLDTKTKINNYIAQSLLYKKGKTAINFGFILSPNYP